MTTPLQVVIIVHGTNKQDPEFADKFQDSVKDYLKKKIGTSYDDNPVIFKSVWWYPQTGKDVAELCDILGDNREYSSIDTRKKLVNFMGAALAYQSNSTAHALILADVDRAIDLVKAQYPGRDLELTYIGHSLGSVIITDYIWDNRLKQDVTQPTNIFTLGSPLALWLLKWGSVTTATPVKPDATNGAWINIIGENDLVAYPLKGINEAFKVTVDMDYVAEIGNFFARQTTFSHSYYWTDDNAIKPIAEKLVMDFTRIHNGTNFVRADYLKFVDDLYRW